MKNPKHSERRAHSNEAGRIHVFWLTSIVLSILLTLIINGVILLLNH